MKRLILTFRRCISPMVTYYRYLLTFKYSTYTIIRCRNVVTTLWNEQMQLFHNLYGTVKQPVCKLWWITRALKSLKQLTLLMYYINNIPLERHFMIGIQPPGNVADNVTMTSHSKVGMWSCHKVSVTLVTKVILEN